MAPLPVPTKAEFQLYDMQLGEIVKEGHNQGVSNWNAIAGKFLPKSVQNPNIYSKTLDQLKKYLTTWQNDQRIRLLWETTEFFQ